MTVILFYQLLYYLKNMQHCCHHHLIYKDLRAVLRDVAESLDGQTGKTAVVYIFPQAKNVMTCHRDCAKIGGKGANSCIRRKTKLRVGKCTPAEYMCFTNAYLLFCMYRCPWCLFVADKILHCIIRYFSLYSCPSIFANSLLADLFPTVHYN
jgi:hypothetical protein